LYASDFPFKNFCKLIKQAETIRNHQNRFWLWLTIVWETHKLTRYQSRAFSCYILKSEQTQKHTRKLTTSVSRSYYSFPPRDWSLVFDPEKPTFSVSSEHKTTCKRPGSYYLPYALPSLWKIRKRISPATLTIWSRNVTTSTREPPTCTWIRAEIWRLDGAICSKNRKIVPYHRCARIPRLTVSVPDYGSWFDSRVAHGVSHCHLTSALLAYSVYAYSV